MELYKDVNVVEFMDKMQKISFPLCGKMVIYLYWSDVD